MESTITARPDKKKRSYKRASAPENVKIANPYYSPKKLFYTTAEDVEALLLDGTQPTYYHT